MRPEDRDKIENIIKDRKVANETLISRGSEVYRSFLDLERKTYSDGSLKKMHKELIAVGISIVINCESCLQWHIGEALRTCASEQQVLEAIEVGIEMGGGPATVTVRFALKVLEYYTQIEK